jgi:hypothetical protein
MPCLAGSYSADDKSRCLLCPVHSHSAAGSNVLAECVCNAGYFGPNGAACLSCAAGKYSAAGGIACCRECEVGKYSASNGSAYCSDCPPGSTNFARGLSACVCLPGFTGQPCAPCPANSFKGEVGPAECSRCPASSFTAPPENTVFTDCVCSSDKYHVAVPD